jgi:hypothetical protein
MPNLWQLPIECEGTAPCWQKSFTVHVSSVMTDNFLGLVMPVSFIHSHSIFFQRNTKCWNLPSLIMHFTICHNSCKVSVVILWNDLNKTLKSRHWDTENYLLLRNVNIHNHHCHWDLFRCCHSISTLEVQFI